MNSKLDGIEDVLLMGPGPSQVPQEVYNALSKKTLGHMDSYFIGIMEEVKLMLRQLFKTCNSLTVPISGTGSAGMEACFVNLLEPGDRVLVLVNGVFGKRMKEVAERLGADVKAIEFKWGTPVIIDLVAEELKKRFYKVLTMVHAETSTGVKNPAAEIGEIVKDRDTLYLLDTVTSLGGMEVEIDAWGVDAAYSASQKCLSCPPGLAPVSFSEQAVKAIHNRKTKVPNWYLDMGMILKYWEGNERIYHHTAPINMLYALYQSLLLVLEEGLEQVYLRHNDNHQRLVEGLNSISLQMVVEPKYQLPMLNSVYIPEGVDDVCIRSALRNYHKIEVGGGLGTLAGKILRIGLMGHTARLENVERFISALRSVIDNC